MMRYKLLFLLLALTSLCVKAATDERSNVITSNTAEATVTFSTGSTYEWEWDATNRRLRSTNYHQPSTTSQTTITITNSSECYLSFDYSASSESNYDKLTITLDGTTIVNAISGTESSSYSKKVAVGTHTLVMKYVKDGSVDSNDDRAYVKNLQLGDDTLIGDDILSGTCGVNVTYQLDTSTGLLKIEGTGNISNYTYSSAPWYNYRDKITTLQIGEGITRIGNFAFQNCALLQSVTIPKSVTTIGNSSFAYCSSLTSCDIPESVNYINASAFEYCTSLTSITIPEGVSSISDYTFQRCYSLVSVSLPESLTTISDQVFSDCVSLTTINLPSNLRSIGRIAFSECRSLTSITIPSSVTSIEIEAFRNCCFEESKFINNSSLSSVDNNYWDAIILDRELENGLVIKDSKVVGCRGWATSVVIPEGITEICYRAFSDCRNLRYVSIPSSVTKIDGQGFRYCVSLESVSISEGMTSIGTWAFYNCTSLTSINIPESVISVADDAFYCCTSLPIENNIRYADTYLVEAVDKTQVSYTLKPNIRFIGGYAFGECSSLTSFTIPEGVMSIGNSAFSGCSSLTSITIPESVTSIGTYAFTRCSALTSITIPKNATEFSTGFFSGCTALTSVELPEGLGRIGMQTFEGCSALSQFTIPSSVESIGDIAFKGCTSLTDLFSLASTPPSLDNHAFDSYNATVHVLPGCGDAYRAANRWNNFTIVEDAGITPSTDIARIDDVTYPSLAEAISAASTMKNPVIEMIGVDDATDAIALSNATLIFPEGTSYAGQITINAGGVLDMQGGSINVSNNEAVHVNSGTLRMSAGSISTSMANKDALYVRNDGKAYIAGGTLTGTRYAMMINGDTSRSGVVEVTGGEFVRLMTGANNNSHSSVIYNWDASYAPVGCMRLSYDESRATLALTEDYEALAEGKWAFDTFPMAKSTNYKNITLTGTYVADGNLDVRKILTIGETGVYTGNMTVYNTYSLTIEGKVNGKVAGYSGSVININGGSVTATDNTSAVEIRSALNMTGGEVTNLSDASNSAAIIIKSNATSVNIEDGVFTGVKGLATDATIGVSQFVHGGKFSNDVTKLANVVEEGLVTTQLPVEGYYTLVKVSDAVADDKTLTINFPVDAAIYDAILDQYPDRQFSYIDMSGDEAYTADDVVLKNATHTNDNTLYNVKNETFAGQTNVIYNGSANDISLTYGYPYVMPLQIDDVARISYTRNYTVADWSDLYLPFDIPAGSVDCRLAEIWDTEVAKTDGNGSAVSIEFVTLDEEESLPANTPAIIKPSEAGEMTIVVENTSLYPSESNSIACSTTKEEFEFCGVYENTTLLDKSAWFFQASTQQFRFVSNPTAYLQSFRFYMTIADKETHELLYGNQAPNMVRFQVIGDDETSINNISDAEIENSDFIYDMSGRRVNGMQKGVYIINGKKTIINK